MEQQGALPLQRTRFRVAGYAQAFPSTALKNPELALQLGVDPEWIRARCGVDSRYISGPGETTTTLGERAARQALTNAPSFRPDCLVCATFTPDYPLCPCGPAIAHALELGPIPAFDLNAACSGGVLGLITALSFIAAGTAERVLLVASDTVTHHLADDDAQTRILFGDGAAAFLIEACPQGIALRSWVMGSDGAGAKLFHVPHGGSAGPRQGPGNGDPRGAPVCMEGRRSEQHTPSRSPLGDGYGWSRRQALPRAACRLGGALASSRQWRSAGSHGFHARTAPVPLCIPARDRYAARNLCQGRNQTGRSGLGTGPPSQHPHRRTTAGAHRDRAGKVDREHGGDRQHLLGFGFAGAWGLARSQRDRGRRRSAFGRFWRGAYLGGRPVRMGRNCAPPAG